MTDRRTPLFPLQALRIADVRSPVACEKPRGAQLWESVTIAANCVTARNCSSARVLIPGHKRARGLMQGPDPQKSRVLAIQTEPNTL